jgi:hypothetical protein
MDPFAIASSLGGLVSDFTEASRAIESLPDDGAASSKTMGQELWTIETGTRLAFVRGVRTFAAVVLFERDAPLGFARHAAAAIFRTLEHELPYPEETAAPAPVAAPRPTPPPSSPRTRVEPPAVVTPAAAPTFPGDIEPPAMVTSASDQALDDVIEPGPATQAMVERAEPAPQPSRALVGDRARRLLQYLAENAPDPHIVKTRLALRSGLGRDALEHPDAMTGEALVVLETAAEDILGLDHGRLAEIDRQ